MWSLPRGDVFAEITVGNVSLRWIDDASVGGVECGEVRQGKIVGVGDIVVADEGNPVFPVGSCNVHDRRFA